MKALGRTFLLFFALTSLMASAQSNEDQLAPENGREPSYCEDRLSVHGLLTTAQIQCGFDKYSNELIDTAEQCTTELGEDRALEVVKFGMREFHRNAKEKGKRKLCKELLAAFPQFIAK